MKRKIAIIALASLLLTGTAYAGSMWGTYKNNPILRLTSNGVPLKVTDVPAMNFMNRTVVPVALLQQIGLKVNYDAATKTVDVQLPNATPASPSGLTLEQLNKLGESVGLVQQLNSAGQQIGTGSAFVVDGIAVTNHHVADGDAVSLKIDFGQIQRTVQIKEAVFDNAEADLIGFKVDGVPGLTLNTGELKKGDKVYSLSYPHHRFQITEGEYLFTYKDLVSHTASVTSGSSGGAVIDGSGNVIGINVSGVEHELSYAIPASILRQELDKVK